MSNRPNLHRPGTPRVDGPLDRAGRTSRLAHRRPRDPSPAEQGAHGRVTAAAPALFSPAPSIRRTSRLRRHSGTVTVLAASPETGNQR